MTPSIMPVGQRLRTLREQQGLSLRALAEQCGLSVNAISLIERGETSPTVSSLHQLATALGVPITSFFEDQQTQAVVFTRPSTRLRSEANGVVLESLGIGLRQQQLEPFHITIAPGAGNLDQAVTHAGEEFVYCLSGQIEYHIGGRLFLLEAGSSLLFEASLPHCFCNSGDGPAELIMLFYAGASNHLVRTLHMEASHLQSA
ncbi:MAG TPA: cupin domain-containing protein [Chloroflexota bacterium]|nr:cupin domain-containing protein [Chloroflexota bacterium]